MGLFTDIDGVLDNIQLLYHNKDYGGGDAQSSSIDLGGLSMPKSGVLLLYTENGSGGDTVDLDIQDSADDSAWADFDTGVTQLSDASDEQTYVLDLDSARRYIRADLASGDQTVGASIDLFVAIAMCGSDQTQSV